jgi:hypothetical protein
VRIEREGSWMAKRPHLIWLASALLALSTLGCATRTNEMKSFVGKSQDDVWRAWGLPNETRPDAKGGQMWIYRSTDAVGSLGPGLGSNSWDKTRIFYFDKDGIVYGWKWKGL